MMEINKTYSNTNSHKVPQQIFKQNHNGNTHIRKPPGMYTDVLTYYLFLRNLINLKSRTTWPNMLSDTLLPNIVSFRSSFNTLLNTILSIIPSSIIPSTLSRTLSNIPLSTSGSIPLSNLPSTQLSISLSTPPSTLSSLPSSILSNTPPM